MLFKAIVGLFTLLILQLGAITGLVCSFLPDRRSLFAADGRCAKQVFTVVKAMQQTSVSASSPVMTVKGSATAVQTANSDFYVDPTSGSMMLRTSAVTQCDTPSTSTLAAAAPQVLQTSPFSTNISVRCGTLSPSNRVVVSQSQLFRLADFVGAAGQRLRFDDALCRHVDNW